MMSGQQLVAKSVEEDSGLDFNCPDCQSLLTLYYDDRMRYMCENCDQEASLLELCRDDGDNNISSQV